MNKLNLHRISVDDLNKDSIKLSCRQLFLGSDFIIRCRNNLILHKNEDSSISFTLPFVSLSVPFHSFEFGWHCPIVRNLLEPTSVDFKRLLVDLLMMKNSDIYSKFEYYGDKDKERGLFRNAKFEFTLKQDKSKYGLYANHTYALVEGVDFGQSNNIEFSKDEAYLIMEKFTKKGYDCQSNYDKSIWYYQDLLECYKIINDVFEETRA